MDRRTVSNAGIALLCVAQFVVVLDVTIVAVALPAIRDDLGFSATSLQWVVSGYGLVFGGLLMLLGRAADLAGRRRVLMAGFALFGGASLACGLAQSPAALLAARAVQGLGAAAVSPAALALLTAAVPEGPRRTKALGVWTAAAAGGGALGWVLGGVLTEQAGWEWVFLVNVAPCALGLVLAPRLLPESRGGRHGRLDVPGAFTVTAGLALLVLGLTRAEQAGIADASTWGSLLAAALLLGAFARIERRAEHPLLPPGTLGDRRLSGALVAAVVITAASTGPLFLVVLHLQDDLGLAPTEAGLLFTPVNLAVIGGSMAGARALERRGAPFMLTAGLALLAAGVLALLGPLPLPVALIAIGAGIGAASLASTEAGTAAAGDERQGLASGLLNTAAQLGNALGLAVFVLLAAATAPEVSYLAAAAAVVVAAVALRLPWRAWTRSRSPA